MRWGATDVATNATGAMNVIARRMQLREQQMLDRVCANFASGHGVLVTQIRSGGGRECYQELITCWKSDGAARNGPNECIRTSE
jgi:hypothetical protein